MKYIGIDVAKDTHFVCILDDNKQKLETFSIKNSHDGLDKFNHILGKYDTKFKIGHESSGVYCHGIAYHLSKKYNEVAIINPKRTKAHRKSLGFEYKHDKIDSYIISDYVKERNLSNNMLPEKYPLLKQLCRTRHKLIQQTTRLKNRIKGNMHILFPEYEKCFANMFCNASLQFMKENTNPFEVSKKTVEDIRAVLLKVSKTISTKQAIKIHEASKITFGIPKDGLDVEILFAIEELELLLKQQKIIESKIESNFEKEFNPLSDVKGLSRIYAAGIIAETGNIDYFKNRDQYYNFTGLVPRHAQSGQFESKFNHVNKCGSSYLRYYYYQSAVSLKKFDPYFKGLYLKKIDEKKSKMEAHVYCAKKLCHIIFRLLKSKKKYCPKTNVQ